MAILRPVKERAGEPSFRNEAEFRNRTRSGAAGLLGQPVQSGKKSAVPGSRNGRQDLDLAAGAPSRWRAFDNFQERPKMFSRRDLLAMSAAGAAMVGSGAQAGTFGNPDEPPQGAINAKSPGSLTDPGPQNPALAKQFPSAQTPPATDVG